MSEDNNNTKPDTKDQDIKNLYNKEHPHKSGAYWDPETSRWIGYKATKGVTPPWNPFDPTKRKPRNRITINERKFMYALSQTGSMSAAFRAVYKMKPYPDKHIEAARCRSMGARILERVRKKDPEFAARMTFDDITPDFVKKEMLSLYTNDHATIAEKIRLLELMGKTQAIFTDKVISDTKIREVVDPIYKDYGEAEDDFPELRDERLSRIEIDQTKIPVS